MDTVDVVLLTFNSERMLRECLDSVYQNIPVGRLIVVDGYSTDRTLEILEDFKERYGNVDLIKDRGTRSTARQKGIEHVKADWFVFVDSDVVLCKDWFKRAASYVKKDVGAVWGIEVWSTIKKVSTLKLFLLITRKIFDLRGGTHDILIRTASVRGIKIPKKLHVFEDAFIKEYIEKGWKVLGCYVPFCIHYRPRSVWTLRGSLSLVVEALRFGDFRMITKLFFAYWFYAGYSVFQLFSRQK